MIDLNGKTILVTGGRGFIGSNFIEYIIENYNNVSIINLDKLGTGSREIYPDEDLYNYEFLDINNCKYQFIKIDLVDKEGIDYITNKYKFDYIFHFAAESHVDRSISDPTFFIKNNVVATANLMQSIMENQPHNPRIVNISTDEVYGHLNYDEDPFNENSPLNPRSPYSSSKASSDLVSLSYYHTFGLDVIVTRCCNNYGEHQCGEKLIPTIMRKLINGEKIPVYGSGNNVREWIYVKDHNRCVLEVADRGEAGEVYNIGSGVEMSNLQLIQKILDQMGFGGTVSLSDAIRFVEDRKGHDLRYAIESKYFKYRTDLVEFDEGLLKTIKFYKKLYGNVR
jgi:dTDP-glucose 4,6-dehydratase